MQLGRRSVIERMKRLGKVQSLAQALSLECSSSPGIHLNRLSEGRGFPTDEEIMKIKEQLDNAYRSAFRCSDNQKKSA